MDKIFKALADKNRRKILDIVTDNSGINVNELSEHFEFSRFAVMKHIKILEDVELIVSVKNGKNKNLYINVMPLHTIYDRWISKYEAKWAKNISDFKTKLEEGNNE